MTYSNYTNYTYFNDDVFIAGNPHVLKIAFVNKDLDGVDLENSQYKLTLYPYGEIQTASDDRKLEITGTIGQGLIYNNIISILLPGSKTKSLSGKYIAQLGITKTVGTASHVFKPFQGNILIIPAITKADFANEIYY